MALTTEWSPQCSRRRPLVCEYHRKEEVWALPFSLRPPYMLDRPLMDPDPPWLSCRPSSAGLQWHEVTPLATLSGWDCCHCVSLSYTKSSAPAGPVPGRLHDRLRLVRRLPVSANGEPGGAARCARVLQLDGSSGAAAPGDAPPPLAAAAGPVDGHLRVLGGPADAGGRGCVRRGAAGSREAGVGSKTMSSRAWDARCSWASVVGCSGPWRLGASMNQFERRKR